MVNWLRSLFGARSGLQLAPHAFAPPWATGRIALLARIKAIERLPDGSLPHPAQPFADQHPGTAGASFAAGTLGTAGMPERAPPTALERAHSHDLATALRRAADDHSPARFARMQSVLLVAAAGSDDAVLERLARMDAHPARMATLARWLATQAPDVAAVRMAIALLGQYGSADDTDLLMTLGLHEEFTLLCAVALGKLLAPEPAQTATWNLARRVRGHGRSQVCERLAASKCPEILHWLQRVAHKEDDTALRQRAS
jgi:hypothetical protein